MFSRHKILLAGIATAALSCASLRADFITTAQPTSTYVSSTTLLDFPDADFTSIMSLSGGGETLSYNSQLEELTVPDSWPVWNSPPAVETSSPRLGFTTGFSSLTISLSKPASTFGLEIEPDNHNTERTTVQYYDGSKLVGTVDLSPNGNGGALLFAASTTTSPFTRILINNLPGDDFSIARQRFTIASTPPPPTVPEPTTFALVGSALMAAGFVRKTFKRG